MRTRREFLRDSLTGLAVAGAASLPRLAAQAQAMALPLGIQLYSVRSMLPKDWQGTLDHLGRLGYREAEAAGYFGHTPAQVNASMKQAGMVQISSHHPFNELAQLDQIIADSRAMHLQYIICPTPGRPHPLPPRKAGSKTYTPPPPMTLEDWKWNADQFNRFGARVKAAGMSFGYHNHTAEFHETEGRIPLEVLIENTDPEKVVFEMDIGWVVVGGGDPVALMKKYPTRFVMIHVKDFKKPPAGATGRAARPQATELGLGEIDYRPIFAEARAIGIKHCFVEQEGFDVPAWQSLRMDADYLRRLHY